MRALMSAKEKFKLIYVEMLTEAVTEDFDIR